MADLMEVTGENWDQEVLKSSEPVVVDFWAPWCGPCVRIAPIVEELQRELAGRVKIAKCNVDDAQDVASRYGVMQIPTLLMFKGGEVIDQIPGIGGKQTIQSKIEAHLA